MPRFNPLMLSLREAHQKLIAELPYDESNGLPTIFGFRQMLAVAYTLYPWHVFESDEQAVQHVNNLMCALIRDGRAVRLRLGKKTGYGLHPLLEYGTFPRMPF